MCLYFLQQGYKQHQMVVLTPYLAQMRELRRELATVASAFIGSMDMKDLLAAGGDPDIPKDAKKGIRVATIDNYQGEESDVVIASLVRSSKDGDIGFIGDKNRVNVLLSRARHGMILVGNLECLMKAKNKASRDHWQNVAAQLKAGNSIYSFFPAKCANHDVATPIQTPEDFKKLMPDGGCSAVCGVPLPCMHKCPKKCHPLNQAHMGIRCKESARITCPFGHPQVQLCSENVPPCPTCQKISAMKAKEEARQKEEADRIAAEHLDIELKLHEAKQNVKKREEELNQLLARIKQEEEVERLKIEANRIEKAIEIKKQQERAVQEQQLAELERATKHQLYELHQESENKAKTANDKLANQQQHLPVGPVKQKVDTILAVTECVKNVDAHGICAALQAIPTSEQTSLVELLVSHIGIAAVDWFSIAHNKNQSQQKGDKRYPGLDLLEKREWMKARTLFLAKKEVSEREGETCFESELGYLLASCKLQLGEDPVMYLTELYHIDTLMPTSSAPININPNIDSNSTNSYSNINHNFNKNPNKNENRKQNVDGGLPETTNNPTVALDALRDNGDGSKPHNAKPKDKSAAQSPWGLRYLTFAVVHDLLSRAKPPISASVPHAVEAAAHALSFLACPPLWKWNLSKLDDIAKEIVKRNGSQLCAMLGHVCSTLYFILFYFILFYFLF
jgi:hypothetical protein